MSLFIPFSSSISEISLPKKFTFPFYYEPHPLCRIASAELQNYLKTQKKWNHNFGLDNYDKGEAIGKMFGVLVVKNQNNELGYLVAFSGKLADKNILSYFVPPVYDSQTEHGFFEKDRAIAIAMSQEIMDLESDAFFLKTKKEVSENKLFVEQLLAPVIQQMKIRKSNRKKKKKEALKLLSLLEIEKFKAKIKQESLNDNFYLRELKVYYHQKYLSNENFVANYLNKIKTLQETRNNKSNSIQNKLFRQYVFLNSSGESKELTSIFKELSLNPPAGTGDCAAPKLLQYAFRNNFKLIAMAEFWWGNSVTASIRKHGNFYPSCKGKCEPILSHMLKNTVMDENPFLMNPAINKEIKFVYEDDFLAIIDKPTELLSVPGKNISDSVYTRMQTKYPNATGPLLVHRLDMATSGIMLIAKTKNTHQILQSQFIKRTVTKKYIAILDGVLEEQNGEINLPLRVDFDDRPRQLVCYEYGKNALTIWNALHSDNGKTRIEFTPITGRTHQLRMHAAHKDGLNMPIFGDDLYGIKADRLYLHATYIKFEHPISKKNMEINILPKF